MEKIKKEMDERVCVTDLPPEVADACWYSMRSWIERMFKDGKRGGFAWHQTKMIHPKRAERHWERDRCRYFMASQSWGCRGCQSANQ